MNISADLIKKLREKTGGGIVEVKKALEESGGNEEQAIEILRKKGEKIALKKQAREMREGIIACYSHSNYKAAALVEITCETDFVAKNEEFRQMGKEIAMQVVAMEPQYLSPEEVPAEVLEKEKEIILEQLKKEGKPEKMRDKITEGKLKKFYEETCLLKQPFIKDDKKTIEKMVMEKIAKLGENVKITRFIKFSL